jgi:hypothetical protein
MEKKKDEWQTIEPGIWKPETEGDQIEGVLMNKEPRDEASGTSARYYIENQDGMFLIWGSAVIDDRMQCVKIPQKVRVTFEGHTKNKNKKNQQVNLFKVEVAKSAPCSEVTAESGTVAVKKETAPKGALSSSSPIPEDAPGSLSGVPWFPMKTCSREFFAI